MGTLHTNALILVMGPTGTGKSAFIRLITNDPNIHIGHDPESQTFDLQTSQFYDKATGASITLVDTPGFDDSREGVTDTDTLRKIAKFLQENGGRRPNGIVYMHRISDPRMGATAKKNLRMFKELCGYPNLGNVFIVTTNWSRVGEKEGNDREAALAQGVFESFLSGGAAMIRHNKELESARSIILQLSCKQPITTLLQEELFAGKALGDTSAGAIIIEDIKGLQKKYELELAALKKELDGVMNSRYVGLKDEIAEERRALKRRMILVAEDHMKLRMSMEEERLKREGRSAKSAFQYMHLEQYPPCAKTIPPTDKKEAMDIWNFAALSETTALLYLQPELLLPRALNLAPDLSKTDTMQALVDHNLRLHKEARENFLDGSTPLFMREMYLIKNIGHRDDWYTDEVFGQQQFTGTDPTSITLASREWVDAFMSASRVQRRDDIANLLTQRHKTLYMQDYSYYRSAMNVSSNFEFESEGRFGCASVVLFHLEDNGRLHPVGITLDYRGSMEDSVTIFNRRIRSSSPGEEYTDWPWRYAKLCAQSSDWLRYEVATHLLDTHFVEEVIIVAAHRTLEPYHVIFKLLEPHWNTTLSLNKSARETLIPKIITTIIGYTPTQLFAFIKGSYKRFHWTDSYVPSHLRRRGFPIEDLDRHKFHNYAYGRNIYGMWQIIRKFVSMVLTEVYLGGDEQVANDKAIAAFCQEVRSPNGGQLSSFPNVKTLDELIDVITMCIHIAAPQHTAVNYLQQYYQTFVPNKPSSLYTRLPQTLAELQCYEEKDVLAALPICKPRDWLLMAQVPYLLSFEVEADNNVLHYATITMESRSSWEIIRYAARAMKADLEEFAKTVARNSRDLGNQRTPYLILDPKKTAISIVL